jgi:hypothetical protein
MRSSILLTAASLASLALSSPINRHRERDIKIDVVTEVVTVTWDGHKVIPAATPEPTQTVNVVVYVYDIPEATPTPAPAPPAPSPEPAPTPEAAVQAAPAASPVVAAAVPQDSPVEAPVDTPTPSPTPEAVAAQDTTTTTSTSSDSGSSDGSPMSGGKSILSSLNAYRSAYGLPLFQWDDKAASMVIGTEKAGGKSLVHSNLPNWASGAGQILTWGVQNWGDNGAKQVSDLTPFEVALGSWLCEVSSDPELKATGICGKMASLYMLEGQTGHHDALVDADYKFIGCGFAMVDPNGGMFQGQWGCNLATQHS